jgi:RNA polymerase-binding transcription factor DksA
MNVDTAHFKAKLEEELDILTEELKTVGRQNPDNPDDWEATPPEMSTDEADVSERADRVEGYEENAGILKELEIRFNNVKDALVRIEKGAYGTCAVDGEPIPLARLEANPAAATCIAHAPKEE